MIFNQAIGQQHADATSSGSLVGSVVSSEQIFEEFFLVFFVHSNASIRDGECPVVFVVFSFFDQCLLVCFRKSTFLYPYTYEFCDVVFWFYTASDLYTIAYALDKTEGIYSEKKEEEVIL